MTIAYEIWNVLKNRYESNFQIRRTKITGPKTKFKNFRLDDGETIKNIYNRLVYIQKEIYELGETLFNEKVIKKYCVLLRKPRCEGYVSALERELENKKVVCFACHKQGRTIQFCFKLFSHVKIKESEGKQDLKSRQKRNGFKSKNNAIAMQVMCSAKSDDSDT
jgi:hypothetical protein